MKILSWIALVIASTNTYCQMNFKPERVSRTASFEVDRPIAEVFPLFGPIREKEWAEGWDPEIIYGSPEKIEEHFIFRTAVPTEEKFYTWTITQFRPSDHMIEYTVLTQNRVWFIRVSCEAKNSKTSVTVTYTYIGLNEKGNALNRAAIDKMFAENLSDWREAINYYLHNNKMLKATATH